MPADGVELVQGVELEVEQAAGRYQAAESLRIADADFVGDHAAQREPKEEHGVLVHRVPGLDSVHA